MSPIKTTDSNHVYKGPSPEVADLHCKVDNQQTSSTWELTSEEMDKVFFKGAHIRVTILGHPIPPFIVEVVDNEGQYKRVMAPCDVCGLEAEDDVHLSGSYNHAYRSRRG